MPNFAAVKHPLRIFSILRLVWKARRPSTVHDMPAVVDAFWLKKGYQALTFFGAIVTRTQEEADALNGPLTPVKNHEMIHLKQAVATGDSWWHFYCLYLKYWLQANRVRRRFPNAGYRLNPFEMEAYQQMNDFDYIARHCKDGATGWKQFAAMTLDERIKAIKTS